jgi:hypothetical protein
MIKRVLESGGVGHSGEPAADQGSTGPCRSVQARFAFVGNDKGTKSLRAVLVNRRRAEGVAIQCDAFGLLGLSTSEMSQGLRYRGEWTRIAVLRGS